MATTSVPTSPKEPTTRIERGRKLYAEHADEIVFEDGVWLGTQPERSHQSLRGRHRPSR